MTRLVAVDVLSDEPGAVLLPSLSLGFGRQFEEVVELGDELLVDALSVEGEAIEGRMRRSRGLYGDTPFQPDSIEAGRGAFGRAVVGEPLFQDLIHRQPFTPQRNQPNVAETGATRAAQVRLTEAQDPVVFVLVSGAVLEVTDPGIGSRLHKSHRIRGGGRGVSVPARPDERIDPVNGCGENVIQNTRSHHQQKPTFHPRSPTRSDEIRFPAAPTPELARRFIYFAFGSGSPQRLPFFGSHTATPTNESAQP